MSRARAADRRPRLVHAVDRRVGVVSFVIAASPKIVSIDAAPWTAIRWIAMNSAWSTGARGEPGRRGFAVERLYERRAVPVELAEAWPGPVRAGFDRGPAD
jgi:hypothetical protein